jgi:hypothetical protein
VSCSKIMSIVVLVATLFFLFLFPEAQAADSRPASLEEIRVLFDLATVGPTRMRVAADIMFTEPKWSEDEIAAEIKKQNEVYPDLGRLAEPQQRERTNAISRSHRGTRVVHVQEWYSAEHYRLDQTDEGIVPERYLKDHPGSYRNTYVNICDPALSPYSSFSADHHLHSAQLSKTKLYGKNDLWRALGLDAEVSFPLLVALADSKSGPQGRRPTDTDLSMLKINPAKAELIHSNSHPIWHLEVLTHSDRNSDMRFMLRGRTMSLVEPYEQSDMELVYAVKWVGQRFVCVEASLTNNTSHNVFSSKREDFDVRGFPRKWKRTTMKPGLPANHIDVTFKEIELNPALKDEDVFSPLFPTNYVVEDITSGQAVVLQRPQTTLKIIQPLARRSPVKRTIILSLFGILSVVMVVILIRMKGDKA